MKHTFANVLLSLALFCLINPFQASAQQKIGTQTHTLKSVGHDWTYHVHVPKNYDKTKPSPLVLVLHGAGGNGKIYLDRNNWRNQAEKGHFIVVAPDGLPARPNKTANFFTNPRLWNSGQLRPLSPRSRVNDIQFFKDLLDNVARQYNIDDQRIYVTGHSNGAGMTFMLGAKLSERFAAIAPGLGLNWINDAAPKHPLPTLYLLGTVDPLIPIKGGESKLPWGKRTTPPVSQGIHSWAKALGCSTEGKTLSHKNGVKKVQYGSGQSGATLTVWYIEGQGHGWPGGKASGLPERLIGPQAGTVNATEVIWDFFAKHRK